MRRRVARVLVVPEERKVSTRPCCCGGDCGTANCSSVLSDCASTGLRPFLATVGISLRKATCDKTEAVELYCENANCGSWGSYPCGGCVPCDPTGSMPGANGRTCPCKDSTCYLPVGRHVPFLECSHGDPSQLTDGCRYGHPDYWYLTFTAPGNEPCDVPTGSECDWLGSVSCAFDLERVPAGFTFVECAGISGSAQNIAVTTMANCGSPGTVGLPYPSNYRHYGWPFDCSIAEPPCGLPPDNQCMCVCNKIFPTWQIHSSINNGCQLENVLYARIEWAVPCAAGADKGGILSCGDQCPCDTEQYSYVAVRYFGQSHRWAPGTLGNPAYSYVDPNDPTSVANACTPLVGDPASTAPGSDCSYYGNQGGILDCYDQCCTCTYDVTIIFRKARTGMANVGQCRLTPGQYEIAGVGPCGDLNWISCVNKTCAYKDKCRPDAEWRTELARLGMSNINFEVAYP